MKKNYSIGVVIPTWNSKKHLKQTLPPLIHSPLKPKILVIDSSSKDGTVEEALSFGCQVVVIPQNEFNHGLTREKARKILQTDIVVMMTDDAYLENHHSLEQLISPIQEGLSEVSYARQIPKESAGFFEAFPREFNYPETSHFRSIFDSKKWGVYTFFCSNSCAAYLNQALDQVGGFQNVLLGEDTVAVASLLRSGYKIAYVAEARVKHSHAYTLKQEFQRYFDTGYARKSYAQLINTSSSDNQRGASLFKAMLKRLFREKPYLIPYLIMNMIAKFLGYHLGKRANLLPLSLKKLFSSQKYFWK